MRSDDANAKKRICKIEVIRDGLCIFRGRAGCSHGHAFCPMTDRLLIGYYEFHISFSIVFSYFHIFSSSFQFVLEVFMCVCVSVWLEFGDGRSALCAKHAYIRSITSLSIGH